MRRGLVSVVVAAVFCARTTAQLPGIKTQRASVWLPFTEDGFPLPNLNRQSKQQAIAAAIAVDQFNARNGSIVKEFSELPKECDAFPAFHHTRTVLDAPVLAVVAARALAAEGLPLGRSAARAGAGRPGRGRPLPQPVVTLTHIT